MNKRVQSLGLMAIVLTLLVGCANTNPNSSTTEDTSTIEESGSLETEIASEDTNSLEKLYEVNYRYDAIVVSQDYGVFPVDNTTPYQELITKTVDIHNFASYFDQIGGRGIDDVMEFMGVECLRETEAGALYSVHKVEQGGLLYIFYSNQEQETEIRTNSIWAWFYVRERIYFSDFDSLQSGVSTIEDVIEINEKAKRKAAQRYKDILEVAGARHVPAWLEADQENLKGTVKQVPTRDMIDVPVNEMLIVELYSK